MFERVASGRVLLDVLTDADMPAVSTVYQEIARSPGFAEGLARARAESAHSLAMQVVMIADSATDKNNAQRIRNRCDQRRWLAGKYNALYSDKIAVTDADGGSIAARLSKMSAEERSAWAAEVAAQARSLLEPPTIDQDGTVD